MDALSSLASLPSIVILGTIVLYSFPFASFLVSRTTSSTSTLCAAAVASVDSEGASVVASVVISAVVSDLVADVWSP